MVDVRPDRTATAVCTADNARELQMNGHMRAAAMLVLASLLSGCVATTTMTAAQDATSVAVKKSGSTTVPRTETFSTTSFGNYEFIAESPGFEPLTGILPLKFNGGYLALDILFFAPAMFFNLREAFAFYEFDLEKRVVKYRKNEKDQWQVYVPTEAEAARGRAYFANRNGAVPVSTSK
jgi:hypothetical protein